MTFVHASALIVGQSGVLLRGGSGTGKSALALALMAECRLRGTYSALVGDDRVRLAECGGRVLAFGHPAIAGQIERRFVGIETVPFEAACVLACVVDLDAGYQDRLPSATRLETRIGCVVLPRLALQKASDLNIWVANVLAILVAME